MFISLTRYLDLLNHSGDETTSFSKRSKAILTWTNSSYDITQANTHNTSYLTFECSGKLSNSLSNMSIKTLRSEVNKKFTPEGNVRRCRKTSIDSNRHPRCSKGSVTERSSFRPSLTLNKNALAASSQRSSAVHSRKMWFTVLEVEESLPNQSKTRACVKSNYYTYISKFSQTQVNEIMIHTVGGANDPINAVLWGRMVNISSHTP